MRRIPSFLALAFCLLAPASAGASFPGPDGRVVFESEGGLATFLPGAAAASPFNPGGNALRDPAYSPDGRWVAYKQGLDIYVARSDGSGARPVTSAGANDSEPAFAPDGKRVAFVRSEDVHVVNLDGSGLANVSNDPARIDDAPDWSPDGRRIAYAGDPCFTDGPGAPQGGPCVFVMNADGSGKTNLTTEEKRDECNPENQNPGFSHAHHSDNPSWSPDGALIAFTGYFDICKHSSGAASDIWVMKPDGSGKTDLMSDTETPDHLPTWAPSGKAIAFVSTREGSDGLFSVAPTGGAVTRLVAGDGTDPNWGRAALPCKVPRLKGKTLAAARKLLERAGCKTGKVRKRAGRRGRVLASKPAAGKSVPAWTKVALTVGR